MHIPRKVEPKKFLKPFRADPGHWRYVPVTCFCLLNKNTCVEANKKSCRAFQNKSFQSIRPSICNFYVQLITAPTDLRTSSLAALLWWCKVSLHSTNCKKAASENNDIALGPCETDSKFVFCWKSLAWHVVTIATLKTLPCGQWLALS